MTLDLFARDAERELSHLFEERVERRLSAVVARAGVAKQAGAVAQGGVVGADAVAEAALLADLGEQPAAGAAAEDFVGEPGDVVIRVPLRDGRAGDADVRLLARLSDEDRRRTGRRRRRFQSRDGALPVAEMLSDEVDDFVGLDVTGDREDRAIGNEASAVLGTAARGRERLEVFDLAHRVPAERVGPVGLAELDHHEAARVVVDAVEFLQGELLRRLEAVVIERRATHQIRKEGHRVEQSPSGGGGGVAGVIDADGAIALNAEAIEGVGELPAGSAARAAHRHLLQHDADADGIGRVRGDAGGQQQRHRRRADAVDALDEQGQAVGEGVNDRGVGQGRGLSCEARREG